MNGEQQGGYPPQQGGYPPPQGGYPPPQGGYPPQPGYPGGPAPRSGRPKVMGILMIIFGSLGLIGSLYGLAASPTGALPDEFLKTLKNYNLIENGIGLLLSALHLVAGIMAVGYKPAAPMLSKLYGIAGLGYAMLRIVLYYVMVAPALKKLGGEVGQAVGAVGGAMIIVIALLVAVWPLLVLILMSGKAVQDACSPGAQA